MHERSIEECYVRAKYRQARGADGRLLLLSVEEEEALVARIINRLPLVVIGENGEPVP